MFRNKKKDKKLKTEEVFLKSCNEYYEKIMEPFFFSCKTSQDFELCHQRTKAQILAELPEKWKTAAGSKKMSSELSMKILDALDAAFVQLKEHFEFEKEQSAFEPPETKSEKE